MGCKNCDENPPNYLRSPTHFTAPSPHLIAYSLCQLNIQVRVAEENIVAFITMVVKQSRQGETSEASLEVKNHLSTNGLINLIDRVVVAEEGDLSSEGMRLAEIYQVDRLPFFLVADEMGEVRLFTAYPQVLKDVLLPANQQHRTQRNVA
jgi:hypothetical protein